MSIPTVVEAEGDRFEILCRSMSDSFVGPVGRGGILR